MSETKKRVFLAVLALTLMAVALTVISIQTIQAQPFYDFGDAPDPTYPTLLASTGASHILGSNVYLGLCVDAEADGQPSAGADGDDAAIGSPVYGSCAGDDDEDGVVFTTPLIPGSTADVNVTANAACNLGAWIDFNADGDWADVGEQILSGQVLVPGPNPLSFPVPAGAATGNTYARFRCTTDPDPPATGQASDGEVEDYMVTISELVAIGNIVWIDDGAGGGVADNGILDGTELGVDGITVELYNSGDTPGVSVPVAATVTAGGGYYAFDNLTPGDYFVHIPASNFAVGQPLEGYLSSTGAGADEVTDHTGDENGIDDATPTMNGISTMDYTLQPNTEVTGEDQSNYAGTLDDNNVNFTADFGFVQPSLFTLGDFVWYDTNQDGIQDAGEPGVPNITVDLFANGTCTPPAIDTDTTNGAGNYGFIDLPPGIYCLAFSNIPAGWIVSPQNQGGDDTVDSDADPATRQITNINLTADDPDEDMGIYAEGSIGDTVWCDVSGNGLYDAGEGVAGVTVDLYQDTDCDTNPDGLVFLTQDTTGDGQYLFTPLSIGPPGGPPVCYYAEVDVADMGACNNPITPITYDVPLEANNPEDLTVDFGFNQAALASIGDYVWRDDNQDGIQDEVGTGIAGVTMNLYECSPSTPIDSTGTDTSGNYSFVDLPPGDYFVECVPPANYTISPQDQGGDDTADSDADPVTGQMVCTTLAPGENDPTWDCGMFQTGPAIEIVKEVSANGWVAPNVPSVAYTLTVTNIGDVTLNPVAVTDDLDPGLTFIPGSATPPETSVTGQQIYWADITGGAGMAPLASLQIAFQVTGLVTPGLYDNFALAEGTPPVGGIVTAAASVSLLVEDPSVAIDKTLNPPGVVGDLVTFTIYIENTGPSTIDVLPLYDTFSGPAIYVGGDPFADSVDNINQQLLWNDLTIPFGQDLHPGQAFYVFTVFQLTNPTTYTVINTAEIPPGGMDVYTNPINQPRSETAVEMVNFRARQWGQSVRLSWETAAEVDTYGFRILRDDVGDLSGAAEIGFVPSQVHGGATGASYEYVDDTVVAGQTYTYWLMDVDVNGIETVNGPVEVIVRHGLVIYLPMILR